MVKGSAEYSNKKNQNPSYCDRVIHRAAPGEPAAHALQLGYAGLTNGRLINSDHRPVCASFEVRADAPPASPPHPSPPLSHPPAHSVRHPLTRRAEPRGRAARRRVRPCGAAASSPPTTLAALSRVTAVRRRRENSGDESSSPLDY